MLNVDRDSNGVVSTSSRDSEITILLDNLKVAENWSVKDNELELQLQHSIQNVSKQVN